MLTALAILDRLAGVRASGGRGTHQGGEAAGDTELEALIAERAKVVKQLDRALDLLLDADDLSGDVRQRAVGLKERRDQLDKQIATIKADSAARPTALRAWRKTKVRLSPRACCGAVGTRLTRRNSASCLLGVFSRSEPTLSGLTFHVRGLEIAFEVAWLKGNVPYREVAGPGLEPGTP